MNKVQFLCALSVCFFVVGVLSSESAYCASNNQNKVHVTKTWWRDVGDPAISLYTSCVLSNFEKNMSVPGLASEGVDTAFMSAIAICEQERQSMNRTLAIIYGDPLKLSTAETKILNNLIMPGIDRVMERRKNIHAQKVPMMEAKTNELLSELMSCLDDNAKTFALSTSEPAETIATATISACGALIGRFVSSFTELTTARDGNAPLSEEGMRLEEKRIASEMLRPHVLKLVLKQRVSQQ